MKRNWMSVALLFPSLVVAAAEKPAPAAAATRPASAPAVDMGSIPAEAGARFGVHLPRTMAMLEASNKGDVRPIRVLFYGQSIVAQGRLQSTLLAELRQRYPKANLAPVSNAIGGYGAPRLVRTMVHDVVAARPDLVVFDDYDGEKDGTYEEIIRYIRSQTTAEVILWSHHLDNFGAGIDKQREEASEFRRKIAGQYECEFADVRGVWKQYLEKTGLPRTALLTDQIHNTPAGCELIARILARHFVVNADAKTDQSVRRIVLGAAAGREAAGVKITGEFKELPNEGGVELAPGATLELAMEGVRVDAVAGAEAGGMGEVRVDGRAPSAWAQTWVASRPTPSPIAWFPALNRVSLGENQQRENWTLHIHDISPDGKSYRFGLTGSVSGADGEGESGKDFVSTSGRIRFLASDFSLEFTARVLKKEFPKEFNVTWRTYALGLDSYKQRGDAKGGLDQQTLFNGMENRGHRLTVTAAGKAPLALRELVVYRPGVAAK